MDFDVFDLGLIDYRLAWLFQKEVFKAVKNGYARMALIICSHYPVITIGRLAGKDSILVSDDELKKRGIFIYEVERGGDVTYHGPGQITAYPVFNLNYLNKDLHWYLRELEQVAIDFLENFGISGIRKPHLTGVWLNGKKIASIGITVKNWITYHGISINIKKDDLSGFDFIKPCGMNIAMTSLETVLKREIPIQDAKDNIIEKFRGVFCKKNNM